MIWVAAHLSPTLAEWIVGEFGHPARALRDLGLRNAKDRPIFEAARQANAIMLTKDSDFVDLVERLGPHRTSFGWPVAIPATRRCGSSSESRCLRHWI